MWTVLDTLVVIFYLGIMVFLGLYFRGKVKRMSDYLVSGRDQRWWVASLSMFSAGISVWALTGAIGMAYSTGVPLMWYYLGTAAGTCGTLIVAEKIRATRGLTMFTFFEERVGGKFRGVVAVMQTIAFTVSAGMRFYATAIFPLVFLGWSPTLTILLLFVACVVYVIPAGMRGVIWGDAVQTLFLVAGVSAVVLIGLSNVGGLGGIAAKVNPSYFGLVTPSFNSLAALSLFCAPFFAMLLDVGFTANRALCVKKPSDAKKAVYGHIILTVVFAFVLVLAGLIIRAAMPGYSPAENSFAQYAFSVLPAGLLGLVLVAAFAATMQTITAQANNITGWITTDIYQRYINPEVPDKKLVKMSKVVAFMMLLAFLGCSSSPELLGGIFNVVTVWVMPFGSPMAITGVALLLTKKITTRVTWAAILAPIGLFLLQKGLNIGAGYVGFTIPAATIMILIIGMLLDKPRGAEKERVDKFFDTLEKNMKEDEKGVSAEKGVSV
jgi:SSS family solute:Na+ symporter